MSFHGHRRQLALRASCCWVFWGLCWTRDSLSPRGCSGLGSPGPKGGMWQEGTVPAAGVGGDMDDQVTCPGSREGNRVDTPALLVLACGAGCPHAAPRAIRVTRLVLFGVVFCPPGVGSRGGVTPPCQVLLSGPACPHTKSRPHTGGPFPSKVTTALCHSRFCVSQGATTRGWGPPRTAHGPPPLPAGETEAAGQEAACPRHPAPGLGRANRILGTGWQCLQARAALCWGVQFGCCFAPPALPPWGLCQCPHR